MRFGYKMPANVEERLNLFEYVLGPANAYKDRLILANSNPTY